MLPQSIFDKKLKPRMRLIDAKTRKLTQGASERGSSIIVSVTEQIRGYGKLTTARINERPSVFGDLTIENDA